MPSPPPCVERGEHAPQLLGSLVDRDQSVCPRSDDLGRRCRPPRRKWRRVLGKRVQPGAVDAHEPVVRDLLAGEQPADHVHALEQALVADFLRRPTVAGDVFIGCLARAERDPEAAGEHLRQRRGRLGDDRRVISLTGALTMPNGSSVVAIAAPSHDQAKPDSPCRSPHGEKWSEDITASKPACSARPTSHNSPLGEICSWDAPTDNGRP